MVVADPRGERVPAGAGLPRLAGGRGAGRGAAQTDGAVQALLPLLVDRLRGRRQGEPGAPRHRRGAALLPQPHRDRRLVPAAPPTPHTPQPPSRRRRCSINGTVSFR